ncbi:MAG: VCBS repeat-containing protein [Planctomycetota bacterium]
MTNPRSLPLAFRTASASLLLSTLAAAQGPIEHRLQYSYLPFDEDNTRTLAHGDVDGDGDLDVVVGNDSSASLPSQQTRLLLNDGRGVLTDVTESRIPADLDPTAALQLADIDGDGDLDLVIAKTAFQNRLFINDGSGLFTDVTATQLPSDTARSTAIAIGDTDSDGDLDIVFANSWPSGRQNFLYQNDGSGNFTNVTALRLPALLDPTSDVALADFDGDGDLDLLTVNGSFLGLDRMMWNDGTGTFSLSGGPVLPELFDRANAVTVADIDGDLDLDYVVGNRIDLPFYDGTDRVMVNDGSGVFTDETASRMPTVMNATNDLELADVNGDLAPDLIVAVSGQNELYINDGSGVFAAATSPLPVHDDRSLGTAVFDVDGDGDKDLMWGNSFSGSAEQNRLYINDGGGAFKDVTLPGLAIHTSQGKTPLAFDADGDGDLDLVTVSEFSSGNAELFLNDGRGVFEFAPGGALPPVSGNVRDAIARDFDGDGDVDLVIALGFQQQSVFLANDGTGTFSDETFRLPAGNHATETLAAADIDADGDVDLIFGNHFDFVPNLLFLNDGNGVFTDATSTSLPPDSDWAGSAAFGDVDGDGDLDLVVGNEQSQNRLYLNDGTGVFTDATSTSMPADSDRSLATVLGDFDGDGDLDIVFGNSNETQNRLYLNDGTGVFSDVTPSHLPVDSDSTEGLAMGDIDEDGDLDLFVGNRGPGLFNRLLLNNGSGVFTESEFNGVRNITSGVLLVDVDGDSDLDVVQTNNGEQLILVNRLRQLVLPVLPSVGGALHLDFTLRPDALSQDATALPLLSFARFNSPVPLPPFGSVFVTPPAVALSPVTLPSPTGTGSLSLSLPANPTLIGVDLHVQTLFFDPADTVAFRLSNLVSTQIQP